MLASGGRQSAGKSAYEDQPMGSRSPLAWNSEAKTT